jgi:hypothetical protein
MSLNFSSTEQLGSQTATGSAPHIKDAKNK